METIIECRDLCHSYGDKKVLQNLNFTVTRGRIFGLIGKNGAGKTTTINILMGFLQPTGGECSIFGEPSYDIKPETRRRIGLLHEGHLQYDFMTIRQLEHFYSAFYPRWNRDVYFSLIDKLGLPLNRKLFRMSCGQRSQVALGLILAQDPELMILDDYSMGLDAGYRRLFLDYLNSYVENTRKTVLVTSHIVQDLEKLVDDIIILDKGNVLVQSTLDDFSNRLSQYTYTRPAGGKDPERDDVVLNCDVVGDKISVYSFAGLPETREHLKGLGIEAGDIAEETMSLEDAFIGITGKY